MTAPQPPYTVGTSPKAIASGASGLVAGLAVALLNAVGDEPTVLLGSLPPALQFVILTIIPPLLTFFSAYLAKPGDVVNSNPVIDGGSTGAHAEGPLG